MAPPSWIPIVLSAVGVIIAFLAFAWQIHRARFNQSVDLLFRLENDFFGSKKAAQRAEAAANLLADANNFTEVEDILDFFETIAMLTRKGALRLYFVWHTFDYWIERYYAVSLPHIRASQAADPGRWEDLDWLLPKLKKLQAKRGGSSLSEAELNHFLNEESAEA